MGISVQTSGIKVEQGKHYLVNLNADPSLNELLVYYLKVWRERCFVIFDVTIFVIIINIVESCGSTYSTSTSNCLIILITSGPHKLWHSTLYGCLSKKNIQAYSLVTVYGISFIIFWCVALKLFSVSFMPLLAPNLDFTDGIIACNCTDYVVRLLNLLSLILTFHVSVDCCHFDRSCCMQHNWLLAW